MVDPLIAAISTVGLGAVGYYLGSTRSTPNGNCGAHEWKSGRWMDIKRHENIFQISPTRDYRGITSADVQWPVVVSRKRQYKCNRCGEKTTEYETFAKIDRNGDVVQE